MKPATKPRGRGQRWTSGTGGGAVVDRKPPTTRTSGKKRPAGRGRTQAPGRDPAPRRGRASRAARWTGRVTGGAITSTGVALVVVVSRLACLCIGLAMVAGGVYLLSTTELGAVFLDAVSRAAERVRDQSGGTW